MEVNCRDTQLELLVGCDVTPFPQPPHMLELGAQGTFSIVRGPLFSTKQHILQRFL